MKKKRGTWKWRLAALGAVLICPWGTLARADLGGTVTYTEPAASLVFPFDATTGKESFAIVSRGGVAETSRSIATHWAYWAADCKHLADVVICLTPRDTVVVDPRALQGEVQNGAKNVKTGPVIDLSGSRGVVTVTAYRADSSCRIAGNPTAAELPHHGRLADRQEVHLRVPRSGRRAVRHGRDRQVHESHPRLGEGIGTIMQRAEDRPHPFCGRKAKRRGTGVGIGQAWPPPLPAPAAPPRIHS